MSTRIKPTSILAATVLGGLALAGCSSSTRIGAAHLVTTAPTRPPATSGATAAPTTTLPPTTVAPTTTAPPTKSTFGKAYSFTVTKVDGSKQLATITVAAPVPSTGTDFEKPSHGVFESFKVTIASSSEGINYNPFDFYIRDAAGGHFMPTFFSGASPDFNSGTLHAGETVSGFVTIDGPATGSLVYQPSVFSQGSLLEWPY